MRRLAGACDNGAVHALAIDVPLWGTPSDPIEEGGQGELARDRVERPSGAGEAVREGGKGAPTTIKKKRKWAIGEKLELESPLIPQGASYADLSSELVTELEGTTKRVKVILEEECRGLFLVVVTRVFSHLLLPDPCFKFDKMMGPVSDESHGDLAVAMEGHMNMLLGKFFCSDDEEPDEEPRVVVLK
ncbi:hypothetical protein D1007_53574 [Hordeum vulgare]|nr:hypothetical protein D1007_53574 [Hordeum vulgare]